MTTVYIGLAAFAYAGFISGMLRLFRCTDYDDLDDEGGYK
jgi:hypothetical protein